jgi:RNA polymerase sigma factor (sigma-70 family)
MESLRSANDNLDLEQAIRQHRGIIYRCISKVLHSFPQYLDPATTDDIFQEVCMLLIEKLSKYDPTRGAKLSTFIGMIATHATIDFLRRERRKSRNGSRVDVDHLLEMASPYESPEVAATGKDLRKHLLAAREKLPPFLQRAFDLEIGEGVADTYRLANEMGIKRGTVFSRRAKLKEKLAAALPEEWQESLAKKAA